VFLDRVLQGEAYNQVLAFDHPTLSVGPVLNAVALANVAAVARS
jgi:hypothetical protein